MLWSNFHAVVTITTILTILILKTQAAPYVCGSNIPGIILASDYDTGGEGIAYKDFEPANLGGAYRLTEGVDLATCTEGGFYVGWTKTGEWLTYTINVAAAGTYTVSSRVAHQGPGGQFHFEIETGRIGTTISVPDTTGWQIYTTITSSVTLPSGKHILKVIFDQEGSGQNTGNFRSFTFASASTSTSAPTITSAIQTAAPQISVPAGSHTFNFTNKCSQPVWVGALGNYGKSIPNGGGWYMAPGAVQIVPIPASWGGRFWGRTGCNAAGSCATGDCGGKIPCNGAGGVPPVSLAEFTLDASFPSGKQDFYDVSLVDGYNLPMVIAPIPGTYAPRTGDPYYCGAGPNAGCTSDLNLICPLALQKIVNGKVVACMSACEKFGTDQYCCRGQYNCSPYNTCPSGSIKCDPKNWSTNYAAIFKTACPTSYSYAYDDPTSTFICTGNGATLTGYSITFC